MKRRESSGSTIFQGSRMTLLLAGAAFCGVVTGCGAEDRAGPAPQATSEYRSNVVTDFTPSVSSPTVDPLAYVDPRASVMGAVEVGAGVYVGPFASARGDEGTPIHLGADTNLQDGVVVHALETFSHGAEVPGNSYEVEGTRWAVYVGDRVSLAHQSQVHGPAWVEDDVFVGMQALVFKAHVGAGVVIEPGCKIIGVSIPPGRYVPAGSVITVQADADNLPAITADYAFRTLNEAVVHVNTSLAAAYAARAAPASGH